MSIPFRAEPTVHARPARSHHGVPALRVAIAALTLLAAGCSAAPVAPFAGAHPADPGTRAPSVGYRSTIAPYVSQRPVEPGPWREQNERVAPAPRS